LIPGPMIQLNREEKNVVSTISSIKMDIVMQLNVVSYVGEKEYFYAFSIRWSGAFEDPYLKRQTEFVYNNIQDIIFVD
jgi:hypothetical protein